MPRIAISYRRSDLAAIAGRIFDWLGERYGEDSVFMDIDKIPFGTDFRSHIREVLLRTDVLIAVVGANWLSHNDTGASRIQDAIDPVRVEIETALERKIAIIPVLVDGAKMPGSGELPATFGNFAYLNAPEISSGRDFRLHMERLQSPLSMEDYNLVVRAPDHSYRIGSFMRYVTFLSRLLCSSSLTTPSSMYLISIPIICGSSARSCRLPPALLWAG